MGLKFWSQMPETTATDEKIVMIGDPAFPNNPKRLTLALIKTYINSATRSISNSFRLRDTTNLFLITNGTPIEDIGLLSVATITGTSSIKFTGLPTLLTAGLNYITAFNIRGTSAYNITATLYDGNNTAVKNQSLVISNTAAYSQFIMNYIPLTNISNGYIIITFTSTSGNTVYFEDLSFIQSDLFLGFSPNTSNIRNGINLKVAGLTTLINANGAAITAVSNRVILLEKEIISLTGDQNGDNKTYYTDFKYIPKTSEVYVNGQRYFIDADYDEITDQKIEFLTYAPKTEDTLTFIAAKQK